MSGRSVTPVSLTAVRLGGRPDLPLLVLGPALGTSAKALWSDCARLLAPDFQVVAWDLPGHGTNTVVLEEEPTVAGLAAGVLELVDLMAQGYTAPTFHCAGLGLGGLVGLQLALDAPGRVESLALLGTGARMGDPGSWTERAATARERGTEALVEAFADRWSGPGFLDREPERAAALLRSLTETDDEAYAALCGAVGGFDARGRLGEVAVPVLGIGGSHDVPAPPGLVRELAAGVPDGRAVELDGVAHLAPLEAPEEVARLLREHALGTREGSGESEPSEIEGLAAAVRAARAAGVSVDEVEELVRRVLAE